MCTHRHCLSPWEALSAHLPRSMGNLSSSRSRTVSAYRPSSSATQGSLSSNGCFRPSSFSKAEAYSCSCAKRIGTRLVSSTRTNQSLLLWGDEVRNSYHAHWGIQRKWKESEYRMKQDQVKTADVPSKPSGRFEEQLIGTCIRSPVDWPGS